jgi:hypothetical protein
MLWGLRNPKLFFYLETKKPFYFQISTEICLLNLSNIHKLQKSFHFIKTTLFSYSSEKFCNFLITIVRISAREIFYMLTFGYDPTVENNWIINN